MDEMIRELHKLFKFKETTDIGDIVVIVMENPQSLIYALVIGFQCDTVKKEEWWHLTMQLLSIPPQKVTWTLRLPQFTGQEIFTMGGVKHYIKAVDFFEDPDLPPPSSDNPDKDEYSGKARLRVIK
ncbi:MAG: hypothetical protein ACQES8_03220 [Thermodesulfobacteriota bacterium]